MVKTSTERAHDAAIQRVYAAKKREQDPEAFKAATRAKVARFRARKKDKRAALMKLSPPVPKKNMVEAYIANFNALLKDARKAAVGGPATVSADVAAKVRQNVREVVAHASCMETQRLIIEAGAKVAADYAAKGQVVPKMQRASKVQ